MSYDDTSGDGREVAPFSLIDGAEVVVDSTEKAGERRVSGEFTIRGGALALKDGYEFDIDPGNGAVAFRIAAQPGTGGRFRCQCSAESSGNCQLRIVPTVGETVLKCLKDPNNPCTGNCGISVVLDPAVIFIR